MSDRGSKLRRWVLLSLDVVCGIRAVTRGRQPARVAQVAGVGRVARPLAPRARRLLPDVAGPELAL